MAFRKNKAVCLIFVFQDADHDVDTAKRATNMPRRRMLMQAENLQSQPTLKVYLFCWCHFNKYRQ